MPRPSTGRRYRRVEDVKCVEKETSVNTVERVQDFTAGRETRSKGNACGPGQIGEGYFDRKPDLEDANQLVVFGTAATAGRL